jgi:tetratricopeptide (TPR) repeat protein
VRALEVATGQLRWEYKLHSPSHAGLMSTAGGEAQVYQIDLKAGQYLEAAIEEKGISIEVRLIDPVGKKLLEIVQAAGSRGIYFIAQAGGLHRLEIAAVEPFDRPFGDCQVTVLRLASPTEKDRVRAEAFQSYLKGRDTNSVDAYQRAAGLFANAELPQEAMVALRSAAFVVSERGEVESEIALRERVLTIQRRLNNRSDEGYALYDIATAYAKLTQYGKAIQYDEQALVIVDAGIKRQQFRR